MEVLRPTRAVIDLAAFAQNLRRVQEYIGPDVLILAVVKGDGYGHGAVEVARAAVTAGVQWLGVAIPEEGVLLRQSGLEVPILVMGPIAPPQAGLVVDFSLDQMVCDIRSAEVISQLALSRGRKVGIHLKVDIGMSRVGVSPPEVLSFAQALQKLRGVNLRGLMGHIATADSPLDHPGTSVARAQIARFWEVERELREAGISFPLRHLANSAAVVQHPRAHADLIRPGIILYGASPVKGKSGHDLGLVPVLTLRSEIAALREIEPGVGVSYGWTFVAARRTRVATVPIGYADGYSVRLSNIGQVLVHGQRVPVIGRVCMDMLMVDVTALMRVAVGDEVVLYGRQGEEEVSVEEVAETLGTISYEVFCAIGKRVPRVYLPA